MGNQWTLVPGPLELSKMVMFCDSVDAHSPELQEAKAQRQNKLSGSSSHPPPWTAVHQFKLPPGANPPSPHLDYYKSPSGFSASLWTLAIDASYGSQRGLGSGSDCRGSIHVSSHPSSSQGGHSSTWGPQEMPCLPPVLGFFTPERHGERGAALSEMRVIFLLGPWPEDLQAKSGNGEVGQASGPCRPSRQRSDGGKASE
ncbi:unnamed protein product [Rangifer tarandus platyrhynchus]|uniref:Uncharacterized protein n=1 Tax=Rangifer tarandus platyrhynchus TaxID=3082113 RepID=A0AC59YJ75_RANTA